MPIGLQPRTEKGTVILKEKSTGEEITKVGWSGRTQPGVKQVARGGWDGDPPRNLVTKLK